MGMRAAERPQLSLLDLGRGTPNVVRKLYPAPIVNINIDT